MGKIGHDEDGKLVKMLEEKSCGLMSIERTYRTINYNVRYVDSYSKEPFIEVTPRYTCGIDKNIIENLAVKFNEDNYPPLFYIDGSYCYFEMFLKKKKKNPNMQILKIILTTYEQLKYLLSMDK